MSLIPQYPAPGDLIGQEGTALGPTDWLTIDQERVDGFSEVTGDHQWIHGGVEHAKAGPFGGTIAHGYMTMSLVNFFLPDLVEVRGLGEIVTVEEVKGAVQSIVRVTTEIEGEEKPACVADTISRYFPES